MLIGGKEPRVPFSCKLRKLITSGNLFVLNGRGGRVRNSFQRIGSPAVRFVADLRPAPSLTAKRLTGVIARRLHNTVRIIVLHLVCVRGYVIQELERVSLAANRRVSHKGFGEGCVSNRKRSFKSNPTSGPMPRPMACVQIKWPHALEGPSRLSRQ